MQTPIVNLPGTPEERLLRFVDLAQEQYKSPLHVDRSRVVGSILVVNGDLPDDDVRLLRLAIHGVTFAHALRTVESEPCTEDEKRVIEHALSRLISRNLRRRTGDES